MKDLLISIAQGLVDVGVGDPELALVAGAVAMAGVAG